MPSLISHSPAETESIGDQWGRIAQSGMVIGLTGDLGAGKTQLVRGIARGLGCTARVHSPTFTLLNEYGGGRLRLFHLDLYRLANREQVAVAGLDEYLDQPDGVAVVEWVERWLNVEEGFDIAAESAHGGLVNLRWARIEFLSENERRISYEDSVS